MGVIGLIVIGLIALSMGAAHMKKVGAGEGGPFSLYILFVILSGMIAVLGFVIGFVLPDMATYFYSGALYLLVFTGVIFCLHIMYLLLRSILGNG